MSTHVLDDNELVTKQEVEVMIETAVVPESAIDSKIAVEKAGREAGDATLQAAIEAEASARAADKLALETAIANEEASRISGDEANAALIDAEAEARAQGDAALVADLALTNANIAEMKEWERDDFPNASCARLKGIPLAIITVSNSDKSLHVGDTIATVGARFLPAAPASFMMLTEQEDTATGAFKTCLVALRLDATGNVNVVNMYDVAAGTSATDEASVTYITNN